MPGVAARALSIKGVSTSATFHRTWSVLVFLMRPVDDRVQCSHNFLQQFHFDGLHSLGPFVAAGVQIG